MKKNIGCYFLIFTLLAVLTGCGTTGFPRQSYSPKKQIKQLEKEFEKPGLITAYYRLSAGPETTEAVRRAARNKIIDGRLALMNLNYDQFIARFAVTKQTLDASTEITELGLNLATTAVGGATTKTILGAISAGVTGSKLAVDKNFFFEKTVPVLVGAMNAQRKTALAPILAGMTNNTEAYPLTRALTDLDAYYFAGTFIGALQAIQADSGAKEKQADIEITRIRDAQFTAEATQNRVDAVLGGIDKLSDEAAVELMKNPPVATEADVQKVVDLRDPAKKRLTDAKAARQILKMQIVLGQRDEKSLAAWEAAVKASE